jgi:hypothetical protein
VSDFYLLAFVFFMSLMLIMWLRDRRTLNRTSVELAEARRANAELARQVGWSEARNRETLAHLDKVRRESSLAHRRVLTETCASTRVLNRLARAEQMIAALGKTTEERGRAETAISAGSVSDADVLSVLGSDSRSSAKVTKLREMYGTVTYDVDDNTAADPNWAPLKRRAPSNSPDRSRPSSKRSR